MYGCGHISTFPQKWGIVVSSGGKAVTTIISLFITFAPVS